MNLRGHNIVPALALSAGLPITYGLSCAREANMARNRGQALAHVVGQRQDSRQSGFCKVQSTKWGLRRKGAINQSFSGNLKVE